MRTLLRAGALIGVATMTVAACTAGGSTTTSSTPDASAATGTSAAAEVELSFLTFETPNLTAAYWDSAIARATAKVPGVKINKLVAPSADRNAYAKQLAASGQLPDIMIAVNPSGFAEAGQFVEWTDEELAPYVVPQSNPIGGKVYQLPYNTQPTPLVYYNKALFAKAGITAPPTTYAEFLEDCAKLKSAGINPMVVGGGGKDTWAAGYPLIAAVTTDVYAKTPDWMSQRIANTVKFNDADFLKALQKIADLAKAGYIDPAGLSRPYADSEKAFLSGKGALYPMGSWFAAAADDPKTKPDFEVGVFAWPSDDGKAYVPAYTGGGMSVSSTAPDVALAKKWAKAFMEDKDNLDASVKADGSIIAIKGYTPPSMGAVYNATAEVYAKAAADNLVTNAFTVETGDNGLPTGVGDAVFSGSVDLISGRKSAADVAKVLDEQFAKATR